ncbi:hypothetical protein RvY_13869 [Ramazzottius varieornatus]|uniref:Uncharacterized protein n=1 Tax=Ramazzottius varieornatus TaxID=947166 RepID=A0A1D1VRH3_RAMVA|nr:hypothetical protein RvY_13869 [Ramazzottius varieornatus]
MAELHSCNNKTYLQLMRRKDAISSTQHYSCQMAKHGRKAMIVSNDERQISKGKELEVYCKMAGASDHYGVEGELSKPRRQMQGV